MLSGFRFSIRLVGFQPVLLTSSMGIPMEPECTPLRTVRVLAIDGNAEESSLWELCWALNCRPSSPQPSEYAAQNENVEQEI